MQTILSSWDPSVVALVLAAAMVAAWAVGWRAARGRAPGGLGSAPDKYSDLILALLGLLLAFTFSISLDAHGERRRAVVAEANAIGDFATCADLQSEPARGRLVSRLPAYVEVRLSLARPLTDEAELQGILGRIDGMHADLQEGVREALAAGTPIAEPLVESLNAMVSSTVSRLSARRARLPASVVLILAVAAVGSMALLGWQHERSQRVPVAAVATFIALVCLVVWVTLDLNRPYAGWIRVSQEPMERLLAHLKK